MDPRAEDAVLGGRKFPARRQNPGSAAAAARRRGWSVWRAVAARRDRPEQFEIGLGVGLGGEHGAIDPERFDLERLGDHGLLGQDVAAVHAAVGLGPQRVAMKERRTVARAQRHRRHLQPRDARGPEGVAVERGVLAGLGQRRHHIGERAERAALDVQRAAGKSCVGKAASRGFQQRQARFAA